MALSLRFPHQDPIHATCPAHLILLNFITPTILGEEHKSFRLIYNYRLIRARRIFLCSFGIVCNKRRIFHYTMDVFPYFCDVIVKTCCILQNFVRQRDSFQFQGTLYECPFESIKAFASRGKLTGKDLGRRAQRTGMSLCLGAWQRASLPATYVLKMGVESRTSLHRHPTGTHGRVVRSPGTLRDS